MNTEMFEEVRTKIARSYQQIFEEQIEDCVGSFPPEEIQKRGKIVKVRGPSSYDEFQWDGKPVFRQRSRYQNGKVWTEIAKC